MSLEMNKIAAAVLTAGIVAMTSGFIAEQLFHGEELEENAYPIQVAETGGDGAPAAEEPAGPEPVLPLLASADPAAGEKLTRACAACHSFEKGGAAKVGPNLYGIVGGPVAHSGDFAYSTAFQEKHDAGAEWTYQNLNAFFYNPKEWAPGTKMAYAGMDSVEDRANLIAYLRSMDDEPAPLPTEEEIAAVTAETEEAAEGAGEETAGEAAEAAEETAEVAEEAAGGDFKSMIAAASADAGQKVARVCGACHSFDKGGPTKVGPNLYDVVGAPIAGDDSYSYSNALQDKAAADMTWTYENLDAFLENPLGWASGTKMTYNGVKDAEDRAALIAYLRQQADNPPPLEE